MCSSLVFRKWGPYCSSAASDAVSLSSVAVQQVMLCHCPLKHWTLHTLHQSVSHLRKNGPAFEENLLSLTSGNCVSLALWRTHLLDTTASQHLPSSPWQPQIIQRYKILTVNLKKQTLNSNNNAGKCKLLQQLSNASGALASLTHAHEHQPSFPDQFTQSPTYSSMCVSCHTPSL
jgi:hypothetical protein